MTDILNQIDSALAAHEAGATFDDAISNDAMRWTTDVDAVPAQEAGLFDGADIIHAYSRARALADGVLVAVPKSTAREAGFLIPVALTAAAWADCVAWTDADGRRKGAGQDEAGRLWDVLTMTRFAIRRAPSDVDRVTVRLYRVPRSGRGLRARPVTLVAHCGPGDDGEPVITLMQPDES